MVVLAFLQNIVVSVLVAYLAFTNTLAEHIEGFIAPVQAPETATEEKAFATLPSTEKNRDGLISKVLLEHAEYQRAAVLANQMEDTGLPTTIGDVSLESAILNALVNIYCQYKTDE